MPLNVNKNQMLDWFTCWSVGPSIRNYVDQLHTDKYLEAYVMQRVNIKQRYIFSAVSCQCVKEVSGVKYVQVLSSTTCRLKCISLTLTFFRYIHLSSWCSVPPHGPSWSKYSQDHFSINISLYRDFINQPATLEWKRQKLFFLRKNSFNRQADWPLFNFGTQNSSAL